MAIKLMTTIHRWNGVSSDIKPVSGTAEGSTFHYIDTGEEFIFTNGMWEDDLRLRNALKEV
ncbi:MAG: hypothetical protein JRC90_11435 [Deltaproteobacteria bacterium]|nr:hypothetical protein [Deltaproteobacteria bacterium]